jgi:hypothetical protein
MVTENDVRAAASRAGDDGEAVVWNPSFRVRDKLFAESWHIRAPKKLVAAFDAGE